MLPTSDPWFARTRIDATTTLLLEPAVHPLLQCNIWHVRGRDRDFVIDTGIGVASLVDAARDLFGTSLLAVATHAHRDHVGGLHEFVDRAIHSAEVDALSAGADDLGLDVERYESDALSALAEWGYDIRGGLLTAVPYDGFEIGEQRTHPAPPTVVLEEGDILDAGDRSFEVLHLPGHSPGSIGLWDARTGVLFSGDAVYDGPLLDEIEGSDIEAYVETMQRLLRLPVGTVHGGHGPSMDRARFHSVITAYLRRRTDS